MEPTSFELSLEQQFELRRVQDAAATMSREQAVDLLMQTAKLLMVKDNVIRSLMKKGVF